MASAILSYIELVVAWCLSVTEEICHIRENSWVEKVYKISELHELKTRTL